MGFARAPPILRVESTEFYAEVQAMGDKRWDTSSLIALLDRK